MRQDRQEKTRKKKNILKVSKRKGMTWIKIKRHPGLQWTTSAAIKPLDLDSNNVENNIRLPKNCDFVIQNRLFKQNKKLCHPQNCYCNCWHCVA